MNLELHKIFFYGLHFYDVSEEQQQQHKRQTSA